MTMQLTRLIQRLQKPAWFPLGKDNPFSFGGGLRNGGLNETAMELLRPIFSFDYMGSAEFEWGAVPNALKDIGNRVKSFETFEIELDRKQVDPPWDVKKEQWKGKKTIYVFCQTDQKEEVIKRLKHIAKHPHKSVPEFVMLKEHTNLGRSMKDVPLDEIDTRAWLELNNGFFFSIDKEMFDKFVELMRSFEGEKDEKAAG